MQQRYAISDSPILRSSGYAPMVSRSAHQCQASLTQRLNASVKIGAGGMRAQPLRITSNNPMNVLRKHEASTNPVREDRHTTSDNFNWPTSTGY